VESQREAAALRGTCTTLRGQLAQLGALRTAHAQLLDAHKAKKKELREAQEALVAAHSKHREVCA
jgi:hypothetical protein